MISVSTPFALAGAAIAVELMIVSRGTTHYYQNGACLSAQVADIRWLVVGLYKVSGKKYTAVFCDKIDNKHAVSNIPITSDSKLND